MSVKNLTEEGDEVLPIKCWWYDENEEKSAKKTSGKILMKTMMIKNLELHH